MNEHVATYLYDSRDKGEQVFEVYACYRDMEQYNIRDVQFYDIYDKNGVCINEGDPFYEFPSWLEIYKLYLVKV